MALFGSWFDNLFSDGSTPPPPVAMAAAPSGASWPGPVPSPAAPSAGTSATSPTPAATPDALTQLAQARATTLPYQKGWQRGLGLFGSALKDAGLAWSGHPEAANNVVNFGQALRQQKLDQLALNAQNQTLSSLSGVDPTKPLPSDIPLQIAKLSALGVDIGPIKDYLATRTSMLPKYTRDDYGNVWGEVPGQAPQIVSRGPGKATTLGPGQSLVADNPFAAGDGGGAPVAQPDSAPASAANSEPAHLPTGDQVAALITQQYPGAQVTSGLRTPAKNAAIDGVANSAHLQDTPTTWARDIKLPPGADSAAAAAQINALGIPGIKALYEGPGAKNSTGPHLHVQYIAPAGGEALSPATAPTATQAPGGARVLFQAPQEWRDPTAAELEQHPGVSQVNGATGELKYTPQSSIPPDPVQAKKIAHAIATYRQAPFTGFVMKTPFGQQVMADVMDENPDYQAEEFPARSAAYKAFKTGPQGNLVRSFNVGISHLNSLRDLTAALGNGDVQLFNKIGQTVAEQTGQTAPTNFDAAKAIVGDEIIKAIVGGGGALADRENAQNQISRAKSPQQLLGVIQTYKNLMAGQLSGLSRQYQNATGRNDFDALLAPETKAELEKHAASRPASPIAGASQTATNPKTGQKIYLVNGKWLNDSGLPVK